jgi:hypothetical protein
VYLLPSFLSLSFLWFCKRKKNDIFVCFRQLHKEIHCDISMYIYIYSIYMCYNWNWFISCFSPFYLSPFLMGILTGLKILYSSCVGSTSTIFTFLTSFFYPPSLICDLPLTCPVFHNIALFVLGLYSTYERKHSAFAFWTWLTSLKMMFYSFIHLPVHDKISLFFMVE